MRFDFKIVTWERVEVPEEQEQAVLQAIKAGEVTDAQDIFNQFDSDGEITCYTIDGVEQPVSLDDNDGEPTIEVSDAKGKTIWDNGTNDENNGWKVTDPSCNQMMRKLGENIFEFKEDRTINPETGETEVYQSVIDLGDYNQDEMFEDVRSFGYSLNEMCTWIDEGTNLDLIAECIFEME